MSDQSPGETFYMRGPAQGVLFLTQHEGGAEGGEISCPG